MNVIDLEEYRLEKMARGVADNHGAPEVMMMFPEDMYKWLLGLNNGLSEEDVFEFVNALPWCEDMKVLRLKSE